VPITRHGKKEDTMKRADEFETISQLLNVDKDELKTQLAKLTLESLTYLRETIEQKLNPQPTKNALKKRGGGGGKKPAPEPAPASH
jgi:hypothetical protein